jgi:hypothetical protein
MSNNVPPKRQRNHTRFTTNPPVVAPTQDEKGDHDHFKTPHRSAVLATTYFCQMMGYHCTLNHIEEVFNVPTTTSSNIIALKRARQLKHLDKPNVRGRPRKLTNQDANSIATYIDKASFKEKGDS